MEAEVKEKTYIDINDSFKLLEFAKNYVEIKDIYTFVKSLDFQSNVYVTNNGVISFVIKDDYVIYTSNGNEDDFNLVKTILEKTKYDIKQALIKHDDNEQLTEEFVKSNKFVINNELYLLKPEYL